MAVAFSFLVIAVLILLNGVFVAAEFAIIGVRASRMEQLADEGNRTAKWVHDVLDSRGQTDRYIATAQLGITLASLGLGMYAEPSIAHLVEPALEHWFGLEGAAVHTISLIIALSMITYLHVVFGEMVPKSLALFDSERTALVLAAPMRFAGRLFGWPVHLLNQIGLLVLRALGVPPASEGSRLYSPDELEMIVSESYEGGMLEEIEQDLVANIFDFADRRVVQVMTPRTQMTAIPTTIGEQELLDLCTTSSPSRFPVYEGTIDRIVGMVHLKDIVRQQLSGAPFDLKPLLRQVPFVPESVLVEDVLALFKRLRLHMAIVLDEFGGTLGLVTLEDLIEEVLGEVRDEFDANEEPPLVLVAPGHLLAKGTVLIEDVEEYVRIDRSEYDVNTIGGLVLSALDRIPVQGEEVTIGGVRLRVESVQDHAVKRVSIHFDPGQAAGR
jgi:CBS domain containing-hemolysin-like protein